MKHCIVVKLNENVANKNKLIDEVESLFSNLTSISGVYKVEVKRNCVDRENRYDFMIKITMDEKSLIIYDESEIHKLWKKTYGPYILSKAIFDYK